MLLSFTTPQPTPHINGRIGYGADIVAPISYSSKFVVQQLYADFDYRLVRLTLGAKQTTFGIKE